MIYQRTSILYAFVEKKNKKFTIYTLKSNKKKYLALVCGMGVWV